MFPERSAIVEAQRSTALHHRAFGDLTRADAVVMGNWLRDESASISEWEPLFIHLTVTGRCNARCKGCINTDVTSLGATGILSASAVREVEETNPERDSKAIESLSLNHPDSDVILCLYGGEPLLAADRISELTGLLDTTSLGKRLRYLIYTNGELIRSSLERYPELMKSIWLYALGIDGGEKQHNEIRRGTKLSRIIENLEALKEAREGSVLMWSTLREEQSLTDCFRQFMSLHERGLVEHFFWHWIEMREGFSSFPAYAERYEEELRLIMDEYLQSLAQGRLLPIAHVNELIIYLLTGLSRGTTACAVEQSKNYDIMGGAIHACADLPPEYRIGDIEDDGTLRLRDHSLQELAGYKNPLGCFHCGIHPYCGGRCPVQALTGSPVRLVQYCQLMRIHVGVVQQYMDRIAPELGKMGMTAQKIYDLSAYIAQFTDVTP
jgi:radical SAM protein with 4Fe4S-binding SPASM domain